MEWTSKYFEASDSHSCNNYPWEHVWWFSAQSGDVGPSNSKAHESQNWWFWMGYEIPGMNLGPLYAKHASCKLTSLTLSFNTNYLFNFFFFSFSLLITPRSTQVYSLLTLCSGVNLRGAWVTMYGAGELLNRSCGMSVKHLISWAICLLPCLIFFRIQGNDGIFFLTTEKAECHWGSIVSEVSEPAFLSYWGRWNMGTWKVAKKGTHLWYRRGDTVCIEWLLWFRSLQRLGVGCGEIGERNRKKRGYICMLIGKMGTLRNWEQANCPPKCCCARNNLQWDKVFLLLVLPLVP